MREDEWREWSWRMQGIVGFCSSNIYIRYSFHRELINIGTKYTKHSTLNLPLNSPTDPTEYPRIAPTAPTSIKTNTVSLTIFLINTLTYAILIILFFYIYLMHCYSDYKKYDEFCYCYKMGHVSVMGCFVGWVRILLGRIWVRRSCSVFLNIYQLLNTHLFLAVMLLLISIYLFFLLTSSPCIPLLTANSYIHSTIANTALTTIHA